MKTLDVIESQIVEVSRPIPLRIKVAEGEQALALISPDGTTARLDYVLQGDADPSGIENWKDLFLVTLTPVIVNNIFQLLYTITPKNGDGTLGTPVSSFVIHTQTTINWRTSAGTILPAIGEEMLEYIKLINYTIVSGDSNSILSNTGASGDLIFTLPAAVALPASLKPFRIRIKVAAAHNIRIQTVGTDTISQGAGVSNAGGYIESSVQGSQIELINDELGKWVAAPLGPTSWSLN